MVTDRKERYAKNRVKVCYRLESQIVEALKEKANSEFLGNMNAAADEVFKKFFGIKDKPVKE